MKKKILLLAGTVLAAMTMATGVYAATLPGDVNGNNRIDNEDPSLILNIALSRDAAGENGTDAFNETLTVANLDRDLVGETVVSHKDGTPEITANDAALAYYKFMNRTSLKVVLSTEKFPDIKYNIDKDLMDTKVKDVVEFYIDQYAQKEPDAKKFNTAMSKLKLGLKGEMTTPYEPEGWNILANAANSLYTEPIYDTSVTDYEQIAYGHADLDNATAKAIKAASLPVVSSNGTDTSKVNAAYLKACYEQAIGGLVNLNPSADAVKETKNKAKAVLDSNNKKYTANVALVADGVRVDNVLDNKGTDQLDALIDKAAAAKLFDYENVTVGDVYKALISVTGTPEKDVNEDGEFASIIGEYNNHDAEVYLVRE